MACGGGSFKYFVEHELGKFPHFVIYAVLEWVLICLLLLDRFLAFFTHEFSKIFELETPCTLCTQIGHIPLLRDIYFYYNVSICEGHKMEISSLAYCHVHRKLSDLRTMCDGCLLGYANECGGGGAGAGGGPAAKCLFDDELRARLKMPSWVKDETNTVNSCSCCGDPMKVKSSYQKGGPMSVNVGRVSNVAPTPSPKAAFAGWRNEDPAPSAKYPDLKLSVSSTPADEEGGNVPIQGKEENKAITAPFLPESDDNLETPNYLKGNRIFGVPLTDSATPSPRFALRTPRKSNLDRMELASDSFDKVGPNETEESVFGRLKTQFKMDKMVLKLLYKELDEERNASAVAANNAMAMITRLQADKAAVQMEALQYQRMMDEQAEYDQEALLAMKDLLDKREDEMRELEVELELYRERYGVLPDYIRIQRLQKSQSFSSFNERFVKANTDFNHADPENEHDHEQEENLDDIDEEKSGSENEVDHGHFDYEQENLEYRQQENMYLENEVEQENGSSSASSSSSSSAGSRARGSPKKNGGNIDDDDRGSPKDSINDDRLSVDLDRERSFLMGELDKIESKLHPSAETGSVEGTGDEKERRGDKSNVGIALEVSHLGKKLRALEDDSRFIKHLLLTLLRGGVEGSRILTEIALHLRKIREREGRPLQRTLSCLT